MQKGKVCEGYRRWGAGVGRASLQTPFAGVIAEPVEGSKENWAGGSLDFSETLIKSQPGQQGAPVPRWPVGGVPHWASMARLYSPYVLGHWVGATHREQGLSMNATLDPHCTAGGCP